MKKPAIVLVFLGLVLVGLSVVHAELVDIAMVNTLGRPDLVGTISADGTNVYFSITAVGQADDGDNINPSKYYNQTNFDNEYFTISAAGKFLKYNMFSGNTTPGWGTSWGDATAALPAGVTFSQTQQGDDFFYDVSMSYAVLGLAAGDTFYVQIKARDFNDDYVESYGDYIGYEGLYSQYRGLWITDTGSFDVTVPQSVIIVELDIKPGSYPNSINLKSKGVLPVAVLTTGDFDASCVDPTSVTFAGATPLRWALEDVDHDGDQDLMLHFAMQDLGLEGATSADLSGFCNGVPIEGSDSVRIVPSKDKGS